jgi:Na+/proline symporter
MDFVKHFLPDRSEEFFLRFSKASTIGWAALLIAVAYASREVPFVLNAAFSLRGLTSGALLGGLLLAVFWRKGSAIPVITGMAGSLLVMIGVSQFQWDQEVNGQMVKTKVFWPWYTLIGATVTLSVAWVVRLIQSPRPATQE